MKKMVRAKSDMARSPATTNSGMPIRNLNFYFPAKKCTSLSDISSPGIFGSPIVNRANIGGKMTGPTVPDIVFSDISTPITGPYAE